MQNLQIFMNLGIGTSNRYIYSKYDMQIFNAKSANIYEFWNVYIL